MIITALLWVGAVTAFTAWYLLKLNGIMLRPPPGLSKYIVKPWTTRAIDEAYKKAREDPVDVLECLPPRTGRRYIVVGGNGMLGGWIVLHLLQRGEDPSHIRILDKGPPRLRALREGMAAKVPVITVDITDYEATLAAFTAPWGGIPADSLPPLTVLHTAAIIRFFERAWFLVPKNGRVNVDGTKNSLRAAREADASYFIYTSSGSVPMRSINFWIWPWQSRIKGHLQFVDDTEPLDGGHPRFISNYSYTKALADTYVRQKDRSSTPSGREIRTAVLRPGSMIYGEGDQALSQYIRMKQNPTWVQDAYSTNIYVENGSVAHLNYEQALIEADNGNAPDVGGKAFLVTDTPQALRFGDFYLALTHLTNGEVRFIDVPAALMLILAQLIEFYHCTYYRLRDIPFIGDLVRSYVPSLEGTDLINLQTGMFQSACISMVYNDRPARKPISEGGIGYNPPFSTIDGVAKFMYQTLERKSVVFNDTPTGIPRAQQGVEQIAEKLGLVDQTDEINRLSVNGTN